MNIPTVFSGPYAGAVLVEGQITYDYGCLGTKMRDQNLHWCMNMMGTD
jgi:hypothetical protein